MALTRAKEKLLLVGSWEDPERTAEKLALELTEAGPAPYTVRRAKNAAQWLLLCALCHPDGGDLRRAAGAPAGCVFWQDYTPWAIHFSQYQPGEEALSQEAPAPQPPDWQLYRRLRQQIALSLIHI